MPAVVEHVCSRILARVEETLKSVRAVMEDEFAGAGVPRGLLHAICLGVLRNYKLLEESLRYCGFRGRLRGTPRGWLPLVVAYEAVFRRDSVKPTRLRYLLDPGIVDCLFKIEVDDVVSGFEGVKRLSILYSVPEWVVKALEKAKPPGGVEKLLKSFQEPTPTWIRFRKTVLGLDDALQVLRSVGVEARADPVLDDVVEVVRASPGSIQSLDQSLFYVQDRSAAAVAHVLGDEGYRVLDFFSAPGNKAAHAAWRSPRQIIGVEASVARAYSERRLVKLQAVDALVDIVAGDARQPPLREGFDAAIVDPDCTSIGRIGHSPETRLFLEKAGPTIIRRMVELQLKGLREALYRVRRGGVIVYSTCTLTVEENEGVVSKVLEEGLAELEEAKPLIGVWSHVLPKTQRIYPHVSRCAGGFIAKLRRV